MLYCALVFSILVTLSVLGTANEVTGVQPDVPMHLTSASFAETLKEYKVVVVMFYASWCSISKNLMQPYDNLYNEFLNKNVILTKVNCIDEPDLYWRHDIKGFPTFGLFVDGESIYFEGEPTIENVKSFIEKYAYFSTWVLIIQN